MPSVKSVIKNRPFINEVRTSLSKYPNPGKKPVIIHSFSFPSPIFSISALVSGLWPRKRT